MKKFSKLFMVLFVFCLLSIKLPFVKPISISIQNGSNKFPYWEKITIFFWIEREGKKVTRKRGNQEYPEISTQYEEKIRLDVPNKKKNINLKGTREGDVVSVQIFIGGGESVQINPFKREGIPNIVRWEVDFKPVKDGDTFIIEQYQPAGATEIKPSIPTAPIKQNDYRLKLEDWVSAEGETVTPPQPATTQTQQQPATQQVEIIQTQ